VIEEPIVNDTTPIVLGVLAEALPDDRCLTLAECAHAAQAAAGVYDLDTLVDFERGERTYTQLWRTTYSEAYAIGWKQAGDTGFHDHDGSLGAVHVVRGTVSEEHIVLRPQGDWLARVEFAAGDTFRFDGAHIHRMRHAEGDTALTVHVYSPPLDRAGAYELSADGTLRRHSIAGDEELRMSETFKEHRPIEDPPPGALEALAV
jgi:Cysteine dioxygenase type I